MGARVSRPRDQKGARISTNSLLAAGVEDLEFLAEVSGVEELK